MLSENLANLVLVALNLELAFLYRYLTSNVFVVISYIRNIKILIACIRKLPYGKNTFKPDTSSWAESS